MRAMLQLTLLMMMLMLKLSGGGGGLEAVNFELLFLGNADACQILANIVTLVSLELNDLAIFWMIDHGAVASKLLSKHTSNKKP